MVRFSKILDVDGSQKPLDSTLQKSLDSTLPSRVRIFVGVVSHDLSLSWCTTVYAV